MSCNISIQYSSHYSPFLVPLLKYIEVLSVLFQLDEDIKLHFIRTLEVQYGVDTSKNPENNLITDAWDAMQRTVRKVTSNVTLPT